jgi:putative ABC transport system permease protein
MFRNFIIVSLRNLWKNRIFSFINIFGLAVSMSICLLIILMLADQSEYDQFHQYKDRTFRILSDAGTKSTMYASSPKLLGQTLLEEYPIIEAATSMQTGLGGDASFQQKKMEMRGYFADEDFFDVFSFELVKGNKHLALKEARSVVLTKAFADKLFGTIDPLGQTITFDDRGLIHLDIGGIDKPPKDWGAFTVSGVLNADNYKTHLKFDALLSDQTRKSLIAEEKFKDNSSNWKYYYDNYTFVRIQDDKTEEDLQAVLNDLVVNKYSQFEDFEEDFGFVPQKLSRITPGIFLNNLVSFRLPIEAYYFLAFLALVVMISACLNYTNLSVARAVTRSKEIGIRKVTGAFKKHLISQFLGESIITSLFALALAILLLVVIKPAFMALWINKYLNFELDENLSVYLIFLGFAVLIGLIAGVVPAFHLSKFRPIIVLKSGENPKSGKIGLRKVLTVSQFVVSLFFIVSTILIFRQTRHYINLEYGFSTENIINIELQGNDFDVVANEMRQIPEVERVSACQHLPASGISSGVSIRLEGSEEEHTGMGSFFIHPNFIDNLDLEIIAGKNFDSYNRTDIEKSIIINEAAVVSLGFDTPNDAVGSSVEMIGKEESIVIAGIVKDFRHRLPMFDEDIGPMVFRNAKDNFSYINLKVSSNDLQALVSNIEKKWAEIDPVHPMEYSFFDDQMTSNYQILSDVIAIIGFFAFMSITIACLGLLGISTYTVERRLKEIGIRKVMGAGELNITYELSKGFFKLLIVSILIAVPLVYFINNLWLQNFANRISFGFGTIFIGTLIMLILGGITIGSKTWRASKANPSDILRNE